MSGAHLYPDSERFLVLLNPGAGGGTAEPETLRRRLGGAFAARGVPFDIFEAANSEEGLEVARQAAERGYRAIVAAGGDGTVSGALRGVAGTSVPVAIVPFGTANQLALNFDIPTSLEDSVRVAVEGKVTSIDLAEANGETFALMAGAGLDAQVMADATAELKSRLGFGAYIYSGLKNVINRPGADFRITADDQEVKVKASMVLVANAGQLGAGPLPVEFRMAPGASFQDGLIDVCIYAPSNLPEVARIIWRVTRNRFSGDDKIIYFQARSVRIEADPPVAIEIDGDPRGETPMEAKVSPQAARIIVPR
ncbi:MAG: diacylglycerol kinase family lipid kinase [Gemmatimonadetes bacterium]|nr:diacylglycerol kinase family lipid kinase [Gemmatimonadota bacterium]MCZ0933719.1 diacylglycerol kinase family lipid kinase [Candidatus Palauibacter rhopaloidicola]